MPFSEWIFSFTMASGLIIAHYFSSRVAKLPLKTQRTLGSIGGGVSIAYVFIHLMPELAIGGIELSKEIYMEKFIVSPLIEFCLFFTSLIGLVVFFSLDIIAASGDASTETNFKLHIIAFALINYLYAYTLPSLVTTGWEYALLFTIVLAAHIILSDRTLARSHPKLFRQKGRWVFTASIGLGLTHAYLFHPISDLALAIATAFLGGGVLMTVFREEIPEASFVQLPWFLFGTFSMSFLLAITFLIGH